MVIALRTGMRRTIPRADGHPSARADHCTVPRARPPGVLQEHPIPTGAELVRAQVRTGVAQYPPTADETGVW
jgi:hypothetical protein